MRRGSAALAASGALARAVFGGWAIAEARHFADGGLFDQLHAPGR